MGKNGYFSIDVIYGEVCNDKRKCERRRLLAVHSAVYYTYAILLLHSVFFVALATALAAAAFAAAFSESAASAAVSASFVDVYCLGCNVLLCAADLRMLFCLFS